MANRKKREHWDKIWGNPRQSGKKLVGKINCSYADIYLPDSSGNIRQVWSFQWYNMQGKPVVYDSPLFEYDWSNSKNPFLYNSSKSLAPKDKMYDNAVMHIGRLSRQALEDIRKQTKGKGMLVDELQENGNYVFYRPRQYDWTETDADVNNENKKGKSWWLLALLAAGILSN